MDGVVGRAFSDEGDARAPYRKHARQLENGRPKNLVEVEGRVDERRQLAHYFEPGDGDPSAGCAEARGHRVRSLSMTLSREAPSCSSARRATVTLAFVAAPLRSTHSLPNDSRRST